MESPPRPPQAPTGRPRPQPRPSGRPRPWARILLAAVVVVVLVLIAAVAPRVRDYEGFLEGFWSGDPTFLEEAGLSEMFLYIAPRERVGGRWCRQGYLVMVDDAGGMVSNQGVEIGWAGAAGRWASALKSNFSGDPAEVFRVADADFTYDEEAVMPQAMSLGLDVTRGAVSLYTADRLYAFLYKDNEVSAEAAALWEASHEGPEGGG